MSDDDDDDDAAAAAAAATAARHQSCYEPQMIANDKASLICARPEGSIHVFDLCAAASVGVVQVTS